LNVRICQKRTVKCLFLLFQITLKCKLWEFVKKGDMVNI
jgi:hypothetical protein